MQKYSIDWYNRRKILSVFWWICFFYTALVAIFVQFIFLPYIAPSLHIGGGFMAELDCSTFHQFAVDLANKIRENGWQEWRLDPGVGTGMSGIAAVFYALFVPKLWVMIPFNAFVHATSGLFIVLIAFQIFEEIKISVISAIPFIIMPSAALWYAQFHKEGLTFLGWFMVFYAAVLVSNFSNKISLVRRSVKVSLLLIIGHFCFTTARQYHSEIFIGFFVAVAVLVFSMLIMEYGKQSRIDKKKLLPFLIFVIVSIILVNWHGISLKIFAFNNHISNIFSVDDSNKTKEKFSKYYNVPLPPLSAPGVHSLNTTEKMQNGSQHAVDLQNGSRHAVDMEKSFYEEKNFFEFLNSTVNKIFSKLNKLALKLRPYRISYINSSGGSDAKSNIDLDVNFYTFFDVMKYMPRALQLAFFAPFPNKWLEEGRVPANTFMKRIAIFEMILVYAGLAGIPFLFLGHKFIRKKEFIVLFTGCCTAMLPLVIVMTNVGIIYRVRYGFLMILVGIGFASFVKFFSDRKNVLSVERPN